MHSGGPAAEAPHQAGYAGHDHARTEHGATVPSAPGGAQDQPGDQEGAGQGGCDEGFHDERRTIRVDAVAATGIGFPIGRKRARPVTAGRFGASGSRGRAGESEAE